jgi:anti-sigma factor RsiW
MKNLKETDIMDYLDGTLAPARMAEVEAHLRENAEDAQLVADLKMAQSALIDWDKAEPVQVSADFWPKLRDKLPAQAPRRSLWTQLSSMFSMPQKVAVSVGVAIAVAVAMLASGAFGPQQTKSVTFADRDKHTLTAEDRAFIERSIQRHDNYKVSQPLGGTNLDKRGDVNSSETGDEDSTEETLP